MFAINFETWQSELAPPARPAGPYGPERVSAEMGGLALTGGGEGEVGMRN